jgi:hypothetical protein
MLAWLKCFLRRRHDPVRHPLGGFKCAECGAAGADLEAMGFENGGWVPPIRRTFDRKHSVITISDGW